MVMDKLVNDIRQEECLWSMKAPQSAADQQEAWRRVASKNKLLAVEVKLIFRELAKKYLDEKKKNPKSTWKLFDQLRFLDENEVSKAAERTNPDAQPKVQTVTQQASDDEMYVELLEVNEEEFSDEESSSKENSFQENKEIEPETVQKNGANNLIRPVQISNLLTAATKAPTTETPPIKRKQINNDPEIKPPPEKLSKNSDNKIVRKQFSVSKSFFSSNNGVVESHPKPETQVKQTENVNGKLNEAIETNGVSDEPAAAAKSLSVDVNSIKIETPDEPQTTIKNEVIRDTEIDLLQRSKLKNRMDDSDEDLPTTTTPHSRAHNSFGRYVSSTLNALPEKLASKLETKILEAIIAVNSEKVF